MPRLRANGILPRVRRGAALGLGGGPRCGGSTAQAVPPARPIGFSLPQMTCRAVTHVQHGGGTSRSKGTRPQVRRREATTTTRDRITSFSWVSTPKAGRGLAPFRRPAEAFAVQWTTASGLFSWIAPSASSHPNSLINAVRAVRTTSCAESACANLLFFSCGRVHRSLGGKKLRRCFRAEPQSRTLLTRLRRRGRMGAGKKPPPVPC